MYKRQVEEDLGKLSIKTGKPGHAIRRNGIDSWSRPRPTKGCRATVDDDKRIGSHNFSTLIENYKICIKKGVLVIHISQMDYT